MIKTNQIKLKLLSFLSIAWLLLICSTPVKASHYGAGDLKIEYIGTGPTDLTYKVILIVYKSCDTTGQASLGTNETIFYNSLSTVNNQRTLNLPIVSGPDTLDQLCEGIGAVNKCRDPQNAIYPGFIRQVHETTVTLENRAEDWEFWWESCCRNSLVLNLCPGPNQASGLGSKVMAGINNLARFDISTPEFTSVPIPYFCASSVDPKVAQFPNSVISSNTFDSINVITDYPLGSHGASCDAPNGGILYTAPYTVNNPVPSATPYYCDPISGTAYFAPNLAGRYVLAFRASQIEKGTNKVVSFVTRDVQIAILWCNSQQPLMDTIPTNLSGGTVLPGSSSGTKRIRVCAGQQVNFNVSATSQSPTNKLNLYLTNIVNTPGATFSVVGQGTSTATGSYSWTPNFSFAGSSYLLTFEAVDSTCDVTQPLMLKSYFNVLIEVVNVMDAGADIYSYCGEGGGGVELYGMAIPNANYVWSKANGQPFLPGEIDDPNIQFPRVFPKVTTDYVVTTDSLPSNACKNSDTVTVFIDDENPITILPDVNPIVQCSPGYLQLNASVAGGKPRTNYPCGPGTPQGPASTSVLGNGTAYSDIYSPFYGGNAISAKTQILLKRKELFGAGMKSTTLTAMSLNFSTNGSGGYENIRISLKCTKSDVMSVNNGFENGAVEVYNNTGITLLNTGWNKFNFTTPYNWDTAQNLIVEICYFNANPVTTGPEVVYTYANFNTMLRTTSLTHDACLLNGGTTLPKVDMYRPYIMFDHHLAPEVDFQYTWSSGNQLSDSTIQNPIAYVDRSTRYKVTTIGQNGCPFSDSVEIFLPVHNYEIIPADTSICAKERIDYRWKGIGGGATAHWTQDGYQPATTIDTPNKIYAVARPLKNTTYEVEITDSVGCKDTLIATVDVRPWPNVKILNNDTVIKYGTEIQLLGSGATIYQWSPAGSLNNPIIPNPIAKPFENTMYYLRGIGTNGCANVDSVMVKLDYRDDLFVPSAFTPNGDGKNDIFRVFNVTFQRLIEFRVFNRFGQEIFSTVNPTDGWDGTWRGVKQDVGTYYYVIRVAYPDGFEETYKGDVTLIR